MTETQGLLDEDFGDFIEAPSHVLNQSVPNLKARGEKALPLIDLISDSNAQSGIFLGRGVVEPLRARFDTSCRSLRHTGKTMMQKLQIAQRKMEPEQKRSAGAMRLSETMHKDMQELSKAWSEDRRTVEVPIKGAEETVEKHVDLPLLNGIMRPVSFARPGLDDSQREVWIEVQRMMEEEGVLWQDPNLWADAP